MSTAVLSRREIQHQLQAVAIYIPVQGSRVEHIVDDCSGLVGYVDHHAGYFVGYMESNRLGASNMGLYSERVKHSAGRLFECYPTIATFQIPAEDMAANLIEVGTIDRSYRVSFTRPGLAIAYGASNGSTILTEDGRQFVKGADGRWSDGKIFLARFDEPEGTFAIREHVAARY